MFGQLGPGPYSPLGSRPPRALLSFPGPFVGPPCASHGSSGPWVSLGLSWAFLPIRLPLGPPWANTTTPLSQMQAPPSKYQHSPRKHKHPGPFLGLSGPSLASLRHGPWALGPLGPRALGLQKPRLQFKNPIQQPKTINTTATKTNDAGNIRPMDQPAK